MQPTSKTELWRCGIKSHWISLKKWKQAWKIHHFCTEIFLKECSNQITTAAILYLAYIINKHSYAVTSQLQLTVQIRAERLIVLYCNRSLISNRKSCNLFYSLHSEKTVPQGSYKVGPLVQTVMLYRTINTKIHLDT